jgi:hypothetical protein
MLMGFLGFRLVWNWKQEFARTSDVDLIEPGPDYFAWPK